MQYEAKTPEEYMDLLEPDWRKEKVEQIRTMIREMAPEIKEGIEYKMLSFGFGEKNIFHLNAQKAYVSFYVGNIDKVENARALLNEFDMGKGCIRIKKSIHLEDTEIDKFIQKTLELWLDGGDTDC